MNYLDRVKPTYIENWPNELYRLSFAQVDIKLSLDEARALGFHIKEFGEGFIPLSEEQQRQQDICLAWPAKSMATFMGGPDPGPRPIAPDITPPADWVTKQAELLAGVRQRVAEALTKFPRGAVVRLGSRSPKDAWSWQSDGPRIIDGDPLRHILDCSERMYEDLTLALNNNYCPHIFVRDWVEIKDWAEFRCFLKDGKVVGVSQYNYHMPYPGSAKYDQNGYLVESWVESINYWLSHYLKRFVIPACTTIPSIVADVAVFIKHRDNRMSFEFKVIEINPFFELTDPCLFNWRDGFDGTFRILDKNKKTISTKLEAS